jgi:hypothetical protein
MASRAVAKAWLYGLFCKAFSSELRLMVAFRSSHGTGNLLLSCLHLGERVGDDPFSLIGPV